MRRFSRYFILLLTFVAIVSCSKFRKIQKSPDWRLKYDAALEYYKNEKYYKSTTLLDEILPIIKGTKEAELGNFYFAYGYFYQKQYVLSAHHFKEFIRTFGRSEYVMEADYMHAMSLYLQSPEYNLDQTATYEAVNALQYYIDRYPASDKIFSADTMINELQVKLETKAYFNAKLYFKIKRFKAALVVFENFRKDFPDSDYNEEVAFMGIDTSYEYAKVSIDSKREERLLNSVERYQDFIEKYPKSEFLKEAEEIFIKSREELAKFADQNKKDT
jgi:outer membrane protein assembly factor BamD